MAVDKPEIFAAYIPVIHQGYIEAFDRHPDARIGVFDQSMSTDLLPYLKKDIRALEPTQVEKIIHGLGREAFILSRDMFESSLDSRYTMPSDDLTTAIENRYPSVDISRESIFLRWDRDASTTNVDVAPDREITLPSDHPIMKLIESEKRESSNWWRHIGAVVTAQNGEVMMSAHNTPVPTPHTSWIDGDPRITSKRGEAIERSIDIHAEAMIIANAAKNGMTLDGTEMYVSTFPCPNCAKLIAECGIKTCYFVEGYAMVDGLSILKANDIEIVKIQTPDHNGESDPTLKPYIN